MHIPPPRTAPARRPGSPGAARQPRARGSARKARKTFSFRDKLDELTTHDLESSLLRQLDVATDFAWQALDMPARESLPPIWRTMVMIVVLVLVATGRQRLLLNLMRRRLAGPSRATRTSAARARGPAHAPGSAPGPTTAGAAEQALPAAVGTAAPAAAAAKGEALPTPQHQAPPARLEPVRAPPHAWRPNPAQPGRARATLAGAGRQHPPDHPGFSKARFAAAPKHAHFVTIS
jgi:hypothetical protein